MVTLLLLDDHDAKYGINPESGGVLLCDEEGTVRESPLLSGSGERGAGKTNHLSCRGVTPVSAPRYRHSISPCTITCPAIESENTCYTDTSPSLFLCFTSAIDVCLPLMSLQRPSRLGVKAFKLGRKHIDDRVLNTASHIFKQLVEVEASTYAQEVSSYHGDSFVVFVSLTTAFVE